ncbi:hemerythrin domain-containing protein [Catellatospora sp. NPDC049111]|uniref:hemerythrin domain-containing protein n=1 Tax=Catellatospora sp. NPDC049111 TaxID=3155271 RepID=UPI003410751F
MSSGSPAGRGHDHSDMAGDIDTMTVNQLRGWLKDHGVTGTSGMRKEELVKAAVKTMRSDQGTMSASIATGKKSTGASPASGAAHKTGGKKTAQPGTTARAESSGRAGETAWEGRHDDVIDLLLSHHEQIKQLFGQVGRAQGAQKQQAWQQLVRLLVIHENIEQQLVHPLAARRLPDGEDLIESRLQEEQQATEDLSQLYEMGVDHPQFDDRLIELRDAVIEHAELEEDEEFGYLRENMPVEQLIGIAATARAAERVGPATPDAHPSRQNGSPAAIANRVRDALRDAAK